MSYTVSYNSNTGIGSIDDLVVEESTLFDLSIGTGISLVGNTLGSWNTQADGLGTSYDLGEEITDGITADLALYAIWTGNNYSIQYDANRGTGIIAEGTATYGSSFTLSDGTGFTKPSGYGVIKEWNTENDGSGTSYDLGYEFTEYNIADDIKLYAIWTPVFNIGTDGIITGLTSYGKTLSAIVVPDVANGVTINKINDNAFSGLKNITSVSISNYITEIGDFAFCCCKALETVTFSDTITKLATINVINDGTLYLTDVDALRVGMEIAFRTSEDAIITDFSNRIITSINREVQSITINGAVPTEVELPTNTYITRVVTEKISNIGEYAFSDTAITTIEIPNTITKIDNNCFSNCELMTSITFKDTSTLKYICKEAFFNCVVLATIVLPASLIEIGYSAFANCRGLTSIVIPETVTVMSSDVFSNCVNITVINCEIDKRPANWIVGWNDDLKVKWSYVAE